ncbi:MAG: CaiB/BaiF CoA transferase family protein [Candidatus Helarchaeota archaeon]
MKLPLKDIKVLDLTRLLPGPYLTMLLADYGADVIKIEDPEIGDYVRWRPPFIYDKSKKTKMNVVFAYLNRNKKSLTLNLKSKKGLEIFYKLIELSDVVIESFRPEVKYKLKIDYETVKKINPTIIYASVSGFGQTGPLKNVAGHDLNYISLTGILGLTGKEGAISSIPATQVGDIGAGGFMGFSSILLALIAREKYKTGQYIDISIYDGLVSWSALALNDYLCTKQIPKKEGRRLIGLLPWYNVYKTKDNKEIAIGALEFKFWKNFCEIIQRPDLIECHNANPSEYPKIKGFLTEIFLKKDQIDWIKLIENIDCCITPVFNLEEVIQSRHLKDRKLIIKYIHPYLGEIEQIGFHFKLSESSACIRFGAPFFGQHNDEILKNLGYSEDIIKDFKEEGIIGKCK